MRHRLKPRSLQYEMSPVGIPESPFLEQNVKATSYAFLLPHQSKVEVQPQPSGCNNNVGYVRFGEVRYVRTSCSGCLLDLVAAMVFVKSSLGDAMRLRVT